MFPISQSCKQCCLVNTSWPTFSAILGGLIPRGEIAGSEGVCIFKVFGAYLWPALNSRFPALNLPPSLVLAQGQIN